MPHFSDAPLGDPEELARLRTILRDGRSRGRRAGRTVPSLAERFGAGAVPSAGDARSGRATPVAALAPERRR